MKGPLPKPLVERLRKNISPEPNSGCWLWCGSYMSSGYGVMRVGSMTDGTRRTVGAHRLTFEAIGGHRIPEGLCLDHLCRTPACVNPDHLEIVTRGENVRRGKVGTRESNPAVVSAKRRTACRHGHAFTEENTVFTSEGHRVCRTCARRNAIAHYHRSKNQ